jgi:hypothetical protein
MTDEAASPERAAWADEAGELLKAGIQRCRHRFEGVSA